MTRKEFIKICSLLGISIPFQSVLSFNNSNDTSSINFKGKVLIIGAGAAGLTAGYLLNQQGIDFQILEASSNYGGRMKIATDFVDFPIPLGAEWLHTKKRIFNEIVNTPSLKVNIETTPYNLNVDYGLYEGKKVSMKYMGFGIDQKFVSSSWFNFFEHYIVPSIRSKLMFNQIVKSIDYKGNEVQIKTLNGTIFEADKIIITVPVKMLQNNSILFTPKLPDIKQDAIDNVIVWDGFKAFIEFSDKFYPTVIESKISPKKAGQKLYYDAAYGQKSNRHVLGLFTVGSGTLPYRQLPDNELIDYMLKELDEIFNGQASLNYINHISQNWNNEPFINGAYVYDHENWRRVKTLGESVDNKVFFAGTAYTEGDDWGSVHNAARSAIRSVNQILE